MRQEKKYMKYLSQHLTQPRVVWLAAVIAFSVAGCSSTSANAPQVEGTIRQSLKANGLNDVSVSQDRTKGVVTLTGHVASDDEKARAQQIAQSAAAGQVVADEIAVLPPGDHSSAKTVNADLDKGIEKNLDAAFIQNGLNKHVTYSVKNGVVTLTGDVNSRQWRDQAAQVAGAVPNVQQVVNEIQLKHMRATSSR
jgi:osmotically-inducible protein OsmY